MIDWTDKSHQDVIVRYIDFGLSEILTPEYRSSKYNIHAQGTPELMPPEIIISSELKKYYKYDKEYAEGKIFRELEKTVKKIFRDLHLDTKIIRPVALELIERIHKSFKDGTILVKYFGNTTDKLNGYVQKSDIYALGMTFYEILHKYCHGSHTFCTDLKKNSKLAHLIKNMIELDPDNRYNVLQCLQHPYFQ
jgi:serine/threonine protein kinase